MSDICKFTGKEFNCARCEGHREDWTGMGTHSMHMGISVSGNVRRNTAKDWRDMAKYTTHGDGSPMTSKEIQSEFMKAYHKGYETIPMSPCDNWCYKNGCQGHAKDGGV